MFHRQLQVCKWTRIIFSCLILQRFRACFVCLAPGVRNPGVQGLGFKVQSLAADDHRLSKMAKQVRDVLPHVPLNVITKDLGRSHSDCTIHRKYCFHHRCLLIVCSKNQLYRHHHNKPAGEQGGHATGSIWDIVVWALEGLLLFLCLCTRH